MKRLLLIVLILITCVLWSENITLSKANIEEGSEFSKESSSGPYRVFSGGDGSSDNPYQIATLADLQYLSENNGYWISGIYFEQTANIDAYETKNWNSGAGFYPIGTGSIFSGVYNGNYHSIDFLYINRGVDNVAMFATINNLVENILLTNVDITGNSYCGGLVGDSNGGDIKNCYVSGSLSGNSCLGLLAGRAQWSSEVVLCHSMGSVVGNNYMGGLIGYTAGQGSTTFVTNCYAETSVSSISNFTPSDAAGLVGAAFSNTVIRNCYSTGEVGSFGNNGGLTAISDNVTNSFWDTETSFKTTSAGGIGRTTSQMQSLSTFTNASWDFIDETVNGSDDYWDIESGDYPHLVWEETAHFPVYYSGGSGTLDDPFQIETLEDLERLSLFSEHWNKYFIQTADIDAYDTQNWNEGAGFLPIGIDNGGTFSSFTGLYNGQSYYIDNLYIDRGTTDYVGLFKYSGYQLENIILTNVNITGNNYVGGIAGRFTSGSPVANCHVSGQVTANGNYAGLLSGLVSRNINLCYATGTVNGGAYIGGLVGRVNGSSGNFVNISNCYADVSVNATASDSNAGGLVGWGGYCYLRYSYSIGSVSGNIHTGGLAGYGMIIINTNSFWDTETSGQSTSVAGTGLLTSQMQTESTYTNAHWDFIIETANGTNDYWYINANDYPHLIWEGGASFPTSFFSGGDGSEGDPWQISCFEDLQTLSDSTSFWGDYFIQTADINAAESDTLNAGAGFSPIGNNTYQFTGSYNGDGYVIQELHISMPESDYTGLFGYTSNAHLSNIHLTDANISGDESTGGIAGAIVNTTVTLCSFDGILTAANLYSGGIAGAATSSVITFCKSSGTIDANTTAGGLIGFSALSDISNCYSICSIGGFTFIGGLIGRATNQDEIDKCFAAGYIECSNTAGGLISELDAGGDCANSFWDTEASGQSTSAGGDGATGLTTFNMREHTNYTDAGWDFVVETTNGIDDIWDMDQNRVVNGGYPIFSWEDGADEEFYPFAGGNGTELEPWQIGSLDGLRVLSESSDFWEDHFIQTSDIEAGDTANWYPVTRIGSGEAGFSPIGNADIKFTGVYDGDGYSINELTINRTDESNIGFFGYTDQATIKNLKITGADIDALSSAGVLAGKLQETVVENCYADGDVTILYNNAGILAAGCFRRSEISGCYSSGTVSGEGNIGGLLGYITANNIADENTISNCYSTAEVTGTGTNSGGLIASCTAWNTVESCYSCGLVSGNENQGGLAGESSSDFTNCFWDTETSQQAASASGTGKTTEEMQDYTTFFDAGWDMEANTASIWDMDQDGTVNDYYPILNWQDGADDILQYFSGGQGTEANPWQISTLEDLIYISENDTFWGDNFIQTADIDAAITDTLNAGAGFSPIGNNTTHFTGSYNGQGNVIDSLYINRSSEDYIGLFGCLQEAVVTNLGVINAEIYGQSYVGALVGINGNPYSSYNGGTVSNCYTTGAVNCASFYAGGIIGMTNVSTITNCYSMCSISGDGSFFAGLIGHPFSDFLIAHCYAAGIITCTGAKGGLFAQSYTSEDNVQNCFWDTEATGLLTSAGGPGVTSKTTAEMQDYTTFKEAGWDFVIETENGENDYWDMDQGGTVNNYYPILSWQEGADDILEIPVELVLPDSLEFAEDDTLEVDFTQYITDEDNLTTQMTYSGNSEISVVITGYDVTFTAPVNWNGSEVITFNLIDDAVREVLATDEVLVVVFPVNDAPTITLPDSLTFAEDGSLVVDFSAYVNDVDGDAITLSYSGNTEISVEIDSLEVTFGSTADWNGTEVLYFTVDDNQSRTTVTDSLDLIVIPVNDLPTIDLPDTWNFAEDDTLTVDCSELIDDLDNLDSELTLSYEGNTNIYVSIEGLEITFTAQADWNGSENITFTITDEQSRNTPLEDIVSVTVDPVNDPPAIALPSSWSFAEDDQKIVDFTDLVSDIDNPVGDLTLSYADNDNIFIEIDGLSVTFTAAANWNGTENIIFTINDNISRLTASDTVAVTVDAVNDAPLVASALIDFSFDEDTTDNHIDLDTVFTDVDLVYGDELTYTYAGNTHIGIEISEGVVTFMPDANWNGNETITFTATDDSLAEVSDEVTITINAVNDAPVVENAIDDFSFDEDTTDNHIDLDDVFTDLDLVYGDELSYTCSGNTHISVGIVDGAVTLTPEADWNGEETITFRATDNYDEFVEDDVLITINPVNDDPVINLPVVLHFAEDDLLVEDFEPYIYDVDGDELLLSFYGNNEISVEISGLEVTFTSEENWWGDDDMVFTVNDQQGRATASQEILIMVTPVNDPPEIDLPENLEFAEDGSLIFDFSPYVNDVDGDELTLSCLGSYYIEVEFNGLTASFTSEENWYGSEIISFTVDDGSDATASDECMVTVTPENDAPLLDLPETMSFDEDDILIEDFSEYVSDIDSSDLTLTCAGNSSIEVLIEDLQVTFSAPADWNGSEIITFTIDDNFTRTTAEDQVTVTVNYVNDAPYVQNELIDFTMYEDTSDTSIDLNNVFADIDIIYGDELFFATQYTAHFTIYISDGLVTITPDADWYGIETLVFTATDSYNASVSNEMTVTVENALDYPIIYYWLENPQITEENGDYFYEFEVYAASEDDTRFISSMLYINYDPSIFSTDPMDGFGVTAAGILQTGNGTDNYYSSNATQIADNNIFAIGSGWNQQLADDFNYDNAALLTSIPQLIMHAYLPIISGLEEEQMQIFFNSETPLSQQTYFTTEGTNDWTAYAEMMLNDMDYTAPEFTNLELTANTEVVEGFTIELDWNTEYYLGTSANTATNIALNEMYQPFYYTNTPDDFFEYWEYKGVTGSATGWQGHMWQIINSNEPIFYLKPTADNPQTFLLIDGLMRDFAGETDPILHLPGDYPRGDYTFSGNISSDYLMSSELDIDLTITTLPGSVPEIAVPTQVNITDVTPDQGGWLQLSYYPSVNDIYHNNTRAPYVNGYILQQGIETERQMVWSDLYNFAPSADYEEILVEVPASDQLYQYRLAAYIDDNFSTWADAGSTAAVDNMGIYANITVILEGAYRSATGMMQSNLDLPLTSPYDGEVINELPQVDIIDWIRISLHNSTTSTAVESCSGFLLADGTIVNTEGEAELPLYYTTGNPYYLVINHRNHIPVMSSDTYILADEQAAAGDIDLTAENAVIGDGIKDMGTFKALYAGDVDGDGFIGATDMNIWAVNYTSSDYIGSDIDLDGLVGATDANIWAVNWSKGSSIPFQRDEQAAGSFSTHNLATANNIYYYLTEPEMVEYPGGDIYCECDIIATCDQPSRFLTGQLFIGYNTEVFGTLAAENYNLWASAGELIDTQVDLPGPAPEINAYSIMSADYDKTTLTVGSVWNPQAVTMMTYENASHLQTETNWLHIALKIENPQSEYEQLLWLEHNELADNQQTYLDHNSNWHSYSGIEYGAPQILTGNAPENRISGVYPNPFNPSTSIHFYLEDAAEVELNIYNIKGQKVNTITTGSLPSGAHSINWNGTNPNNRTCASGVYFFQLTAGAKTETYRALMLK